MTCEINPLLPIEDPPLANVIDTEFHFDVYVAALIVVATAHKEESVSRLHATCPVTLLPNCAWIHGSQHRVFCDRSSTSVGISLKLKQMEINDVGMSNQKRFSHLVKLTFHDERTR